ncbi:serine/threonine-protein kinase/endoribonuclease IRE1-like [Amphibalanus amphitrite]|uniref:serine/threonine-protein kinase/endoribonuclease IRE1-like n=1 Tax=Amphibalanus amphitrite TaxID=1232801 RepID=UPI001C920DEF|nr:serine/threonine-protein kinase/endoribonuclease IRE1-like [Amphibalanus amphitrite]
MELGVCTVNDYVTKNDKFIRLRNIDEATIRSIDEVKILRDSSEGLEWLHKRQIMHRDIKPENILLVRDEKDGIVAKLTDFGISKELTSGTQAMTSWKGTLDWMAPEVQESGGQVGSVGAADVFSLGLVFYYVLSEGKHPFSKNDTMTAKVIKSDSACLDDVPKGSMRSLIEEMIQITPGDRPSSKYVARHPTFWEPQKTQLFYQAISDLITATDELDKTKLKEEELKAAVNEDPTRVFGEERGEPRDWRKIIDTSLDKGHLKSYDATISGLLRLIRNKLHHFDAVPEEGRRIVHNTKSGLVNYIADKFPLLLMHVWEAAEIRRDKPDLRDFYSGEYTYRGE